MTDTTPTLEHPEVRDLSDRFGVFVDGSDTPAGIAVYVDHESADGMAQRIFPHTVVEDRYEGHGLASTLVREALTRSVAAGRRIVPVCPYVKSWLAKHGDVVEGQVDQPTAEHFAALDAH